MTGKAPPTWDVLIKRFAKIVYDAEGPSKRKSGLVRIVWDSCENKLHVGLGTYDIADWPSWTYLGPFEGNDKQEWSADERARFAVEKKLDEAEEAVKQEMKEDEDE